MVGGKRAGWLEWLEGLEVEEVELEKAGKGLELVLNLKERAGQPGLEMELGCCHLLRPWLPFQPEWQ